MRLILIALSVILLTACSRYDAEVGYYEGGSEKWDIWGDFRSLDECRDAAIAQFNFYNRKSEGRAFSWACLKKSRGGGYESRHR
jgi:hypothetical protein